MPLEFFTVSLPDNIPTLKISISRLNRFYQTPSFSIICPASSVQLFKEELVMFPNVLIRSEEFWLTFTRFKDLAEEQLALSDAGEPIIGRLGWYYQQALKLTFLMSLKNDHPPMVMWDADTIPMTRIKFFSQGRSVLYGSRLEFHHPYFQTMTQLFGTLPPRFLAFTIQFFTATQQESRYLRSTLEDFLTKENEEPTGEWIARIVIKSVYKTHTSFEGSLFSEQELVGLSNLLNDGKPQRQMTYLRWGFSGIVSSGQMRLIRLMGFKHITYENVENIINKKQSWFSLLIFIAKQIYRQRLKHFIAPVAK
jgi:hypothetical protein